MASVKFVAVSRSLKGIIDYVKDREKTDERLISGVNCVAESALDEFESVKKEFHKTDGRAYYHIVQAFSPDDPLDFDTAHEIGCKFAGYFQGYQALVVTHRNTAHIHNHIILNSVSFEDGRKFHQSAYEMRTVIRIISKLGFKLDEDMDSLLQGKGTAFDEIEELKAEYDSLLGGE